MPFQTHPENREFTGGVCGGGGYVGDGKPKGQMFHMHLHQLLIKEKGQWTKRRIYSNRKGNTIFKGKKKKTQLKKHRRK